LFQNDAKWLAARVAHFENPPLATGTYPAWYTAALRTSDPPPGDVLPECETPESDISTILFDLTWIRAFGLEAICRRA